MNMKKYISISYMFRPIQGPSFIFSGDLFGLPTYAYNLCSLYSGPYIISQLWLWLWRQLRFWSQCLVKNVQRTVKCSAGQTFVVQLVLIFPGFVVMWAHFATGNNWARQNRFVFIRQKPGQIYNKVPSSEKPYSRCFSHFAKIKISFQRTSSKG